MNMKCQSIVQQPFTNEKPMYDFFIKSYFVSSTHPIFNIQIFWFAGIFLNK